MFTIASDIAQACSMLTHADARADLHTRMCRHSCCQHNVHERVAEGSTQHASSGSTVPPPAEDRDRRLARRPHLCALPKANEQAHRADRPGQVRIEVRLRRQLVREHYCLLAWRCLWNHILHIHSCTDVTTCICTRSSSCMHICHYWKNVYMRECAHMCKRAHETYKELDEDTSKHSRRKAHQRCLHMM